MKITWIDTSFEKPKSQKRVFVLCQKDNGEKYVNIGQYIAHKTVHSEDFLNPDYCYDIEDFEYHDEETDILWVEENWFESVTDADVSWVIMDKIIAWAEIPEVNL